MDAAVHFLAPIVLLGALCAGWVALQRWIARIEPDLGGSNHCGGGCCSDKLCEIEKNDPWFVDNA